MEEDAGQIVQIEGESARVSPPRYWTYAKGAYKGRYTGKRAFDTPVKMIELLRKDKEAEGIDGVKKRNIGLIMPSNFHVLPMKYDKLQDTAQLMGYVGFADLDFSSETVNSSDFKELVRIQVNNGATLAELCGLSPDFARVVDATRIFCTRLVEKGLRQVCWFTGGKGFRIAWMDTECYLGFNKDSQVTGDHVADIFMRTYLGDACHGEIQQLCKIDPGPYRVGNGLKSDLFPHPDTGVWPVLVDFLDTDNKAENIILKRIGCDGQLGRKILEYWSTVVANLPESWDKCCVFKPQGVESVVKNGKSRKRRPVRQIGRASCRERV